jgi:UDP-N-acetylglucosamine acyltransferase
MPFQDGVASLAPRASLPAPVVLNQSAAICATLRIATLQKNFNHHFENALTFNARQTPFNLVILVQFGHHAKPTLTHCGLAICEIYSDGSAFRLTQKTSTASHCPSNTSNARQAKRREKNPAFISGHLEGKTLGNQAKTVKNTPKKHVTIMQLLTCFFCANLSIKVKVPPLPCRSLQPRAKAGLFSIVHRVTLTGFMAGGAATPGASRSGLFRIHCQELRAMIHPSAVIHPRAKLDSTVSVGPCAVIDEGVELGANCVVGPLVYLTGLTTIGAGNVFHAGCVIGDTPQDFKYKNEPTRVRIGDNNTIREHATIQRSNKIEEDTVIGSRNFIAHHSHVAHNCQIGNEILLGGGAILAGHVAVHDRAFISGNCLVHQFCRVGALAMMQGGSAISKDLPPYCVSLRQNEMCGLNVVGLRRAGITAEERRELKKIYLLVFRSGKIFREALAEAEKSFSSAPAKTLLDFLAGTKRGICSDVGKAREENENE